MRAQPTPAAALQVDLRPVASKFTGLAVFLASIAGQEGGTSAFRRLYEASAFGSLDSDSVKSDAVRRFAALGLSDDDHVFSGYPPTHGQTVGAWSSFRIATAKATSWDDLRDRTAGLFPNEVQQIILEAMQDIEPAYDALLWDPYGPAVRGQVATFEAYARRHDLGPLVRSLALFYGASWPDGLPLWVAFHPAPPGGFSATVAGNVVTSRMPAGFDDYDVYASVMLHELSHRLYSEQPPALAWQIQETMLGEPSQSREFAYRWLDEALATAANNGWAYRQLADSLDAGPWYDDPVINGYARALYPSVAEYLESGREIDAPFLRSAVAAFETTFPEALTDPRVLFAFSSIVTDETEDVDALLGPLYERYRLRGTTTTNEFSDASIAAALGTPGLTVVLVTDPSPEKEVLLGRHLPGVRFDASEEVSYHLVSGHHPALVIQAAGADALARILDRIGEQGLTPSTSR